MNNTLPSRQELEARRLKRSLLQSIMTRTVETVMQLRIDVKKQQTERFSSVLAEAKNSRDKQNQLLEPFLIAIVKKDMYAVTNRFQPFTYPSNFFVTIQLNLVEKKTGKVEVLEVWKISFSILEENMVGTFGKGSQQIQHVKTFFQALVERLASSSFYTRYWRDNQQRKRSMTTHMLDYQISYMNRQLPEMFDFDRKSERQLRVPGLRLVCTSYHKNDIESLKSVSEGHSTQPSATEKPSTILKKTSSSSGTSTKKHSFYSYEDQELDVTIISSDSDISKDSPQLKNAQLVEFDAESSDEQYVMIEECLEDTGHLQFKRALGQWLTRIEQTPDTILRN